MTPISTHKIEYFQAISVLPAASAAHPLSTILNETSAYQPKNNGNTIAYYYYSYLLNVVDEVGNSFRGNMRRIDAWEPHSLWVSSIWTQYFVGNMPNWPFLWVPFDCQQHHDKDTKHYNCDSLHVARSCTTDILQHLSRLL